MFVGGLGVLSAASVLIGNSLPRIPDRPSTHAVAGSLKPAAPRPSRSAPPRVPRPPKPVTVVTDAGRIDLVPHPWKTGQPQLGVDVYWSANPSERTAVTNAKIVATVDDVVGLHANWISISFPFATGGPDSDELSAEPSMTPSLSRLGTLVTAAKAAGLRVVLRPLLNETNLIAQNANDWRGSIDPASVSDWFDSYTAFLTPYAQLAQRDHVDAFNLSTELSSMEDYTSRWKTLSADLASRYSGELVTSFNYNRIPADTTRIPDAGLGVDAYFPIADAPADASVAKLVSGWNHWLNEYSTGPLSDLTFSEVGIVPQDGAYQAPYVWEAAGAVDPRIQVTWDTAACQVARTRHAAGIFWWYLDLENVNVPSRTTSAGDPMDILSGQSMNVIRNCFETFTEPIEPSEPSERSPSPSPHASRPSASG